jgi:hypothetical protein
MVDTFSRTIQLALRHERRIFWAVASFPLLAVALIAFFKLFPRLYTFLIAEDRLVEWGTAIAYLVAAGFAISLVLHFRRHQEWIYVLLYGVLAAGMFVIAMEEISWGQRQLGIETPPTIAELNYKKELNVHNMGTPSWAHRAFMVVVFYGSFSRLMATPWLIKRFPKFVDLVTPPYVLFLFFFVPFLYYVYLEFFWSEGHYITGKDQEPIELLLALGFLVFVVFNWVRYRVGAPLTFGGTAGAGLPASDGRISAKKPAAF